MKTGKVGHRLSVGQNLVSEVQSFPDMKFLSNFSPACTKRTVLRPPTIDDLDSVYRIHSDPETNKFNPRGPDRNIGASEARLREWIEHWEENGFGYWAVVINGSVAGYSGVRYSKWFDEKVLNLYYRFDKDYWGYGYATEVARYAVKAAELSFPHLPIMARTKHENKSSIKIALNCGLLRKEQLDKDVGSGIDSIYMNWWS